MTPSHSPKGWVPWKTRSMVLAEGTRKTLLIPSCHRERILISCTASLLRISISEGDSFLLRDFETAILKYMKYFVSLFFSQILEGRIPSVFYLLQFNVLDNISSHFWRGRGWLGATRKDGLKTFVENNTVQIKKSTNRSSTKKGTWGWTRNTKGSSNPKRTTRRHYHHRPLPSWTEPSFLQVPGLQLSFLT